MGQAGAGLVEVEANGLGQIVRVTLDPALVERRDREMLEDSDPLGHESGAGQSQATSRRSPARLTGGMNLPGLDDMLTKLEP